MSKQNEALSPDPPSDESGIRCPRLGHQINFSYCRSENSGLPCFKTLDCWFNHFDVHTHLKDKLSDDDFEKVFMIKGKPKVLSLVDLIEKANAQANEQAKSNKGQE